MEFIDSHSHLFVEDFDSDRQITIESAISKGISRMILPNIDLESTERLISTCHLFPESCFAALGLHPTSVKEDYKKQIDCIFGFLPQIRCVAIGEIGIDLYWDKTFLEQQIDAFKIQVKIAQDLHLPIIIHCRNSFNEIINTLHGISQPLPAGIFHSFTGTYDQAKEVIDMNFKIGFNGVITYKNAQMDDVIANIPLENIVLETDSPYLTPVPFRGKRNESSYLIYIAQKIADVKQIPLNIVATVTTRNVEAIFQLN